MTDRTQNGVPKMKNIRLKNSSGTTHPIKSLQDSQKQDFSKDENEERGNWSGRADFILAAIGCVIGLSNIWKFPYLCYKYGGITFLISYSVSLIFLGIPMFYLEVNIGQFTSSGMITCWTCVPLMKGVGFCMMMLLGITSIYYMGVISWALWYFGYGLLNNSDPKWIKCNNEWNTPNCSLLAMHDEAKNCLNTTVKTMYNTSINLANGQCYGSRNLTFGTKTKLYHLVPLGNFNSSVSNTNPVWKLPTEEFFFSRLTNSLGYNMNKFGTVQWELAICLGVLWIITFLTVIKGVKLYGKIVYFTSFFKFSLIITLFLRGVTLNGQTKGLNLLFEEFDYNKLLIPEIWMDAMKQTFFSLGLCEGTLITLASFNRFHNDSLRDTVFITLTNHVFSILCGITIYCYLGEALSLSRALNDTNIKIEKGIDLLFILIPYAITYVTETSSWTIILFLLVIFLGIDSIFAYIHTMICAICDIHPNFFRKNMYKLIFSLCFIFFLLGLILCFNGGVFLLHIVEKFTGNWIRYIICFLECIAIIYVYGGRRFAEDIGLMIGSRTACCIFRWSYCKYWWIAMWAFIAPAAAVFTFVFEALEHEEPSWKGYTYPKWSEILAWLIVALGGVLIISYTLWKLSRNMNLKDSCKPSKYWGPYLLKHRLQVVHSPDFCLDPHQIGVDFVDLLKCKLSNNTSKA